MKLPHLHPGKLYSHVCANIIFLTLSMGWIHCYSCLRFLVQPEEAVHQKFMPVSLQWAQLLNEIVLSACALQGGQHFRPIYFLLGEFKADIQDTVCLHTQSWNDTILSMRNFFSLLHMHRILFSFCWDCFLYCITVKPRFLWPGLHTGLFM